MEQKTISKLFWSICIKLVPTTRASVNIVFVAVYMHSLEWFWPRWGNVTYTASNARHVYIHSHVLWVTYDMYAENVVTNDPFYDFFNAMDMTFF